MSRESARYTRDGSSVPGGSVVYDDRMMHTHSDTAPTRGSLNAFDLVRIEKYGSMDAGCASDIPMAQRPSYIAMSAFVNKMPEIRSQRAADELEDLGPLPADWLDTPAPPPSPFRVIEAAEFAGGEYVEPDWQVHELVPKVGSGLDIGESKTFKSFKILDLATCIHRGVPYRDRPVQKGRSVIVCAEGAHGYPLRMRAYAKHHGVSLAELPAIIPAAPNLFERDQVTALIKQLKILGATYVAIDTKWRCSLGAEENSAKDNAIVFGSIERIAHEVGCFCTAISHVGKDPTRGVRGSSSQIAAVDVEVMHERAGDCVVSTVTKLKDGPDGAVFTFKMLSVDLGISRKTGKPFGSLVVEHIENSPVQSAKLPAVGTLNRIALDAVKAEIVKQGRTLDLEEARTVIVATKSEPEPGKPDRRGSRAGREIDALRAGGFLFLVAGKISDTPVVRGDSDAKF